jgi:hypothetical protein
VRALILVSLLAAPAFASERCFELSRRPAFDRLAGVLCVDDDALPRATVTLKSTDTVATLKLELTERVRCLDCNRDVFAPASRDFDFLAVRFDGKRSDGLESGTVSIGRERLFYRSARASAVVEAPPPPPAPPPPAGPQPMRAEEFAALLKAMDDAGFSVSRLESTVASAAAGNFFTSQQVAAVIGRLPLSFRDEAAEKLVPKVVDPESLFRVSTVLGSDASRLRPRAAAKR